MEVIAERAWSWMLFADGGRLLLSVVCGGAGVYEVEFELMDDEAAVYRQAGPRYLDELARAVRSTPVNFAARMVSGLLSGEQAKMALAEWRQRQSVC
jgi:hypothetical protein